MSAMAKSFFVTLLSAAFCWYYINWLKLCKDYADIGHTKCKYADWGQADYESEDAVWALAYVVIYAFLCVLSIVSCFCMCGGQHGWSKFYAVAILFCMIGLTVMDFWTLQAMAKHRDGFDHKDTMTQYYVMKQVIFWFSELNVFMFAAWDAWDQSDIRKKQHRLS